MSRFLAHLFLMSASISLWVLLLTKGFGLEIKSWWWVIGFVVANAFLQGIRQVVWKETANSIKKFFNVDKKETK